MFILELWVHYSLRMRNVRGRVEKQLLFVCIYTTDQDKALMLVCGYYLLNLILLFGIGLSLLYLDFNFSRRCFNMTIIRERKSH